MELSHHRQTWMDLLRGLAVLLIVLNHAAEDLVDAMRAVPPALDAVNNLLAPFRIPMLLFLSGLLLSGSLNKGSRPYFQGKISNVAWPYLVWLLPQALTKDTVDPVKVLLGDTQLWFLLFLGFYYVLAYFLKRVPPPVVVAGALALSWLAPGGEKYGERLWFLFACFMVGHWASSQPAFWRRLVDDRVPLLGSLLVLGVYLASVDTYAYGPQSAVGTAAGVIVLCHVAKRMSASPVTAPLRAAGRHSLVIFVSHAVGMQVVLRIAEAQDWTSTPLLLTAFLLMGVGVPVALIALRKRWLPAEYLFTLTPRGAPFPLPLRRVGRAQWPFGGRDRPGSGRSASRL